MISKILRIHLVCLILTFHISDIFGKSLEITAETNSDKKVGDATKLRKKREITSKFSFFLNYHYAICWNIVFQFLILSL